GVSAHTVALCRDGGVHADSHDHRGAAVGRFRRRHPGGRSRGLSLRMLDARQPANMIRRMRFLLPLLAGVIGIATATAQFVPPASSPDEQARFLTGRRLPPGSLLEPIQREPAYLDHARTFSETWKRFDERYFSKMRAFSAT